MQVPWSRTCVALPRKCVLPLLVFTILTGNALAMLGSDEISKQKYSSGGEAMRGE